MGTITLIHPDKDIVITEQFTAPFLKERIIKKWKETYGKLYYRCKVEVMYMKKKVEHIETGEIYNSCSEAGRELGIDNQTVSYHARDPRGVLGRNRLFRYVEVAA